MTSMRSPSVWGRRPPGGLNLFGIAGRGPPRAFAIKISKLNTESPLVAGGGRRPSLACRRAGPGPSAAFFAAKFQKTFFCAPRCRRVVSTSSTRRRPRAAQGGGGLKSLAGRAPGPLGSSRADFFSARGLLNSLPEIKEIKRPRKSLDLRPFVRAAERAHVRSARKSPIYFLVPTDRASSEKLPRNSGWGGVARMRRS